MDESFHNDHHPNFSKFSIANTAHHQQMLWAAKRPILRAMRENSLGNCLTDSGKFFQVMRRRGIDVYA